MYSRISSFLFLLFLLNCQAFATNFVGVQFRPGDGEVPAEQAAAEILVQKQLRGASGVSSWRAPHFNFQTPQQLKLAIIVLLNLQYNTILKK